MQHKNEIYRNKMNPITKDKKCKERKDTARLWTLPTMASP